MVIRPFLVLFWLPQRDLTRYYERNDHMIFHGKYYLSFIFLLREQTFITCHRRPVNNLAQQLHVTHRANNNNIPRTRVQKQKSHTSPVSSSESILGRRRRQSRRERHPWRRTTSVGSNSPRLMLAETQTTLSVDGNTSSVNKLCRRADQVYPAAIRQLATATSSISHRPSSTK